MGHRALIEFERTTGKPVQAAVTFEDNIRLLWCGIRHGAKLENLDFSLDFEQFIDYVDAHPEVMDFPAEKKSAM
jgi:hypothetical protein